MKKNHKKKCETILKHVITESLSENVGGETNKIRKIKSAKESVDNFLKGGKKLYVSGRMTANVFSINFRSLN